MQNKSIAFSKKKKYILLTLVPVSNKACEPIVYGGILVSRVISVSSAIKSRSSCQLVWKKRKVWKTESLTVSARLHSSTNPKALSNKRRSKTRVKIGSAFARWSQLKEFQGLKSHAKVATSLLDQ